MIRIIIQFSLLALGYSLLGGDIKYNQDVSIHLEAIKNTCKFTYLAFQVSSASGTLNQNIGANIKDAIKLGFQNIDIYAGLQLKQPTDQMTQIKAFMVEQGIDQTQFQNFYIVIEQNPFWQKIVDKNSFLQDVLSQALSSGIVPTKERLGIQAEKDSFNAIYGMTQDFKFYNLWWRASTDDDFNNYANKSFGGWGKPKQIQKSSNQMNYYIKQATMCKDLQLGYDITQ